MLPFLNKKIKNQGVGLATRFSDKQTKKKSSDPKTSAPRRISPQSNSFAQVSSKSLNMIKSNKKK